MDKRNPDAGRINRRKVLQATTSIAGLGITASTVSASDEKNIEIKKETDIHSENISEILTSDPVKEIEKELRQPTIEDGDGKPSKVIREFSPSRESAEQMLGEDSEGNVLFSSTRIDVGLGKLVHVKIDKSEVTENAYLIFNDETSYHEAIGMDSVTESALVRNNHGLYFNYSLVGEEERKAAELIEVDPENISVYASTSAEDYEVWVDNVDNETDASSSSTDSEPDMAFYKVDPEFTSAELVDELNGGVSTQLAGYCATLALQCIKHTGVCFACVGSACSNPLGGVSGACIACVILVCGSTGGACGVFAADCSEYL